MSHSATLIATNGAHPVSPATGLLPHGLSVDIVYVTPADATVMLQGNTHNRPVSDATVRRYAAIMAAHYWYITTDAIGIDTLGRLTNGQHRLLAVILSGLAQPFLVVRGVSAEAHEVTDVGKRRSAADTLALLGFPNAAMMGYVCKALASYIDSDCVLKPNVVKTQQENFRVAEIAGLYPEIRESAAFVRGLEDGFAGIVSPSMFAFLHVLATRAGNARAFEDFATRVSMGLNVTPDSGVHRLRDRLLAVVLSKMMMPPGEVLALVVKAFRLDFEGRPVKILRWRSDGEFPEAYPQMPGSPSF